MPQLGPKAEFAAGFRPRRDSNSSDDSGRRESISEDTPSGRERRDSFFERGRSTSISEEPISPISSSPPGAAAAGPFGIRRGIYGLQQPAAPGQSKIMSKILSQNFSKTTKNFDKLNSEW